MHREGYEGLVASTNQTAAGSWNHSWFQSGFSIRLSGRRDAESPEDSRVQNPPPPFGKRGPERLPDPTEVLEFKDWRSPPVLTWLPYSLRWVTFHSFHWLSRRFWSKWARAEATSSTSADTRSNILEKRSAVTGAPPLVT